MFTDEQIGAAFRHVEIGASVTEGCRKLGFAETMVYLWPQKFVGLDLTELQRLR